MTNVKIAGELVKIAKMLSAIEFPNQGAMDKYLKDHPDADKSNHRVVRPSQAEQIPFADHAGTPNTSKDDRQFWNEVSGGGRGVEHVKKVDPKAWDSKRKRLMKDPMMRQLLKLDS